MLVTEDNRQVLTLPEGNKRRHQFNIRVLVDILRKGQRMFRGQMTNLMTTVVNKDSRIKLALINRPWAVTGEHVGFPGDTQVSHGCIKGNRIIRYHLILIGKGALLEFLREHDARAKDTIKRMKQLGVECSQRMDELQKEQLRSSRESKHSLSDIFA